MNDYTKQLIEKAKQGDNIAISELMNQYNSELFNLAKMYSSSDSDAEDALQNTYIRAFRNLSSLEDINIFDSWIKQITVNEAKRINGLSVAESQVAQQHSLIKQSVRETQRRFDPMTGELIVPQANEPLQKEIKDNNSSKKTTGKGLKNALKIVAGLSIVVACIIGGKYVYDSMLSKTNDLSDPISNTNDELDEVIEVEDKETDDELGKLDSALANKWILTKETSYDDKYWEEVPSLLENQHTIYEYNLDGNKIKDSTYFSERFGGGHVCQEYKYNTNGDLIRLEHYDKNDSLDRWIDYEYDSENHMIKEVSGEIYREGTTSLIEYEYDTDGNMIKEKWIGQDNTLSIWIDYEYNAEGNLIRDQKNQSDGSCIQWNEYEYDADGKAIKRTEYDVVIYPRTIYYLYEYDINGNMIMKTAYNLDGTKNSSTVYEYDNNCNLVRKNDGLGHITEYEWMTLEDHLKNK